MRKKAFFVSVLFFALLIGASTFGRQQEAQPVELKKLSDNLYEILGGRGARGGAYIGDDGVLIIDAKMDRSSVEQVIEEVRKMTDKPIKYLVNTHSDGDHVQGNRFFPESVVFIAHDNCRKEIFHPGRDGSPSEWNKPELAAFTPAITFTTKMNVYLRSKKVELWHFGVGHTTGDAVVYFPEEKTAFLGDQIFIGRPQLIHSYKGGNSFEHVKTLIKMLDTLDAEYFCSGHSEMTDRKGIEDHIARMQELQKKVRVLMKQKKGMEEVKEAFDQSETRLVESIYNEIKAGY
ncbi:MAG: MBL fold metallo-hydrolase [bacterium]